MVRRSKQSETLTTVGTKRVFPLDQDGGYIFRPGLTALRGFYSSVIGATSRILVNINITHSEFYQQKSLGDLMAELYPRITDYPTLQQFVKRLQVTTKHLREEDMAFGKVGTIFGLAARNHGAGPDNPPKSSGFGPTEVSFFKDFSILSSSTSTGESSRLQSVKDLKAKEILPSSTASKGRHISVQDFFRKSKSSSSLFRDFAHDL